MNDFIRSKALIYMACKYPYGTALRFSPRVWGYFGNSLIGSNRVCLEIKGRHLSTGLGN